MSEAQRLYGRAQDADWRAERAREHGDYAGAAIATAEARRYRQAARHAAEQAATRSAAA